MAEVFAVKADSGGKGLEKRAEHASDVGELLDMEQAIGLLKTTRSTFYRWLRSGKIKGMKVGRQWRFERQEIDRFLKGEAPRIELRADIAPLVEALEQRADRLGIGAVSLSAATGVQQAVGQMIRVGLAMRASDIHLHPVQHEDGHRTGALRLRIDGVLQLTAEIDYRLMAAIVEQWKVFAACDLLENRKPQDGRLMLKCGGDPIDIRLSFLPAAIGETLTARLLSRHGSLLSFDQLDHAAADKEKLLRHLRAPRGLILVTGPAGTGKTTTIYACLNRINDPAIKIMTAEDPVEYILSGTVQVALRQSEGVTFATCLRSFLRSDPDVIMIGEIRDRETALICQQAALTGNLVMTTLHTDDAAGALTRLVEIGSPPFLVADTARLVVSQRLVRMLCQHCARPAAVFGERLTDGQRLARAGGLGWENLVKDFREPSGCEACRGLGHSGRTVIAESLEVTPAIGKALRSGATAEELRTIAVGQGMTTMAADGIRRAAEGQTTLDEVMRVLAIG